MKFSSPLWSAFTQVKGTDVLQPENDRLQPAGRTRDASTSAWNLKKGETILRKHLHDQFGGGRQGGIASSAKTPNILIFSDPNVGHEHGYRDRWDGNHYLYAGEGQTGDQQMTRGNKAIRDHLHNGKALRLFWGTGGEITCAGEFRLDAVNPWSTERAQASGGGGQRSVIIFRLVEVSHPSKGNTEDVGARG